MTRYDWDPREDAWLAGFTDGEGCFYLGVNKGKRLIQPRFQIALRADDAEILEELRRVFGGSISWSAGRDWRAPACRWMVVAKRELSALVTYFDRFPPRAKKAADYAVWRTAVGIYCSTSGRDPRLAALRDVLSAGRAFDFANDPDAPDPLAPFEVQTALEIGP